MSDLTRKTIFSAWVWDAAGTYILKIVTLTVSIILARILDPVDFGVIGIILALSSFAQIFVDFGFSSAIIQSKDLNSTKLSSVFYINLGISLLLTLILFFFSNQLAIFFDDERLFMVGKVMSVIFIIKGFNSVQISLFRKKMQFKKLTISYTISALLSGCIGIYMAYAGYGLWSLVFQILSNSLFLSIFIWLQSNWKPKMVFSFNSIRDLFSYGSNIMLSALVDGIFSRLDIFFIGKLFAMESLGFYTRAKSFKNTAITLSTGSLSKVLFPTFSAMQDDKERVKKSYLMLLKLVAGIITLFCGMLFLIAEDFYVILITEKWLPSVPLFQILILSGIFYPLSSIMINIIKGLGHSKLFLQISVVKKIIQLPSFVVGYYYGVFWFLISVLCLALIGFTINMWAVQKTIGVKIKKQFLQILPELGMLACIIVFIQFLRGILQIESHYLNIIWITIVFISLSSAYHFFSNSVLFKNSKRGLNYLKSKL